MVQRADLQPNPACNAASEEAWAAWSQPQDPFQVDVIHGVPDRESIPSPDANTLVHMVFLPNDPTVYLGLTKAGAILKFRFNATSKPPARKPIDDPAFVFGKGFGGYTGTKTLTCKQLSDDANAKHKGYWCTMCDGNGDCVKQHCPSACGWDTVGVMLPVHMCGVLNHSSSTSTPSKPTTIDQSSCQWSAIPKAGVYNGIGLAIDPDFNTSGHVYMMWADYLRRQVKSQMVTSPRLFQM